MSNYEVISNFSSYKYYTSSCSFWLLYVRYCGKNSNEKNFNTFEKKNILAFIEDGIRVLTAF